MFLVFVILFVFIGLPYLFLGGKNSKWAHDPDKYNARFGGCILAIMALIIVVTVGFVLIESWSHPCAVISMDNASECIKSNAPARIAPTAPGAGWGVHVCGAPHYAAAQVMCAIADNHLHIERFAGAKLAFTGVNGADFPTSTLTVSLSTQNSVGVLASVGSTQIDSSLTHNAESVSLAQVFAAVGASPRVGTTYEVEVDAASIALGTATFTIRA